MKSLILAVSVVFAFSCGSSSFNSNDRVGKSSKQASPKKPSGSNDLINGSDDLINGSDDLINGSGDFTPVESRPDGSSSVISVPDSAVMKGIFTVWTVPEDPRPEEDYDIYIKVSGKIGRNVISGSVVGTDMYIQAFSTDGNCKASFEGDEVDIFVEVGIGFCVPREISSTSAETVISVPVPGAENLVKDIVEVKLKIHQAQS